MTIRGIITGGNNLATTNAINLSFPAGTVAGDAAFIPVSINGSTLPVTAVIPTGWTALNEDPALAMETTAIKAVILYKRLDAGELSGVTLNTTDGTSIRWAAAGVVVAQAEIDKIDIEATQIGSGTVSPLVPTVAAMANTDALLFNIYRRGSTPIGTVTPPAPFTKIDEVASNNSGSNCGVMVATYTPTSAGNIGGGTMTATQPQANVSVLITTKSASSVIPPTLTLSVRSPNGETVTGIDAGGTCKIAADAAHSAGAPSLEWSVTGGGSIVSDGPMAILTNSGVGAASDRTAVVRCIATDKSGQASTTKTVSITLNAATKFVKDSTGALVPVVQRYYSKSGGLNPRDSLNNVFPGGGGQSGIGVSPFNENHVLACSDTSAPALSLNGLSTSQKIQWGLIRPFSGRKSSGAAWGSASTIFALFGSTEPVDNTNGAGLCVIGNALSPEPGPWRRIDGIANPAQLQGGGGTENSPEMLPSVNFGYPRSYGRTLIVDSVSSPTDYIVHVATVANGAWRLRVNKTTLVPSEQIQYAGTAGKYIRCLAMPVHYDGTGDYSKIVIVNFNRSTPVNALRCDNANTLVASPTLSTTAVPGIPQSIESLAYAKSATGQPLTVMGKTGGVWMSTNLFTAAAGSVTSTQVSGATVPDTSQTWISTGITVENDKYVVLVGTIQGAGTTPNRKTIYRGVVAQSSTTPWSSTTWEGLTSSAYSWQILGRESKSAQWWLGGTTTPGTGSAAVSHFEVAPTNPSVIYAVSKGTIYVSRDTGRTWTPGRQWGSADHTDIHVIDRVSTETFTSCGDWTLAISEDGDRVEPRATSHAKINVKSIWSDPITRDIYIGGGENGSPNSPAIDNKNNVWKIRYAKASAGGDPSGDEVPVALALNTGSGAGVNVGIPLNGIAVRGTQGTGAVVCNIVACAGQKGIFYNNGNGWVKVNQTSGTKVPFGGGPGASFGAKYTSIAYDQSTNSIYFMDRDQGTVWRTKVSSTGTLSTADAIYTETWAFGVAPDIVGHIDIEPSANRLWISTPTGIRYIPNAGAAAHDSSTAVVSGFSAAFPNEIPNIVAWSAARNALFVTTNDITTSNERVYPRNSTTGARALVVTGGNTTSSAPWLAAENLADKFLGFRSFTIGYQRAAMAENGSKIHLAQLGSGVMTIRLT